MSAEPQTAVPPDVARDVSGFARALVGAVRSRKLYSPDHPAAVTAVGRLQTAIEALASREDVFVGVSPDTLFVNGEALNPSRPLSEAAAFLHDHDILRLRVAAAPTQRQLADFLQVLSLDTDALRKRGGPAACWADFGHRCFVVDQIDYSAILTVRPGSGTARNAAPGAAARLQAPDKPAGPVRDSVWHTLVRSLSSESVALHQSVRQRLHEIAQSADGIEALTTELIGAQTAKAGANLQAAQAASVLFAFERLVRQIESMSPDTLPAVLRNIATAASRLDPDLLMQAICESAESGVGSDVTGAIGGWFDDGQVAKLLARSMGAEGRATGRLAAALNTLAPDPERQHRVLRLARTMTQAPGAQATTQVAAAWESLEGMLDARSDKLFTSADYAHDLQAAELRSHRLRLQTPEHQAAWIASVSSESIRTLSVTLLLDLFTIEEHPAGIVETALDLAAAAEDLLSAGDIREADRVLRALDPGALASDPGRAAAARRALDRLALSPAIGELGVAADQFDPSQVEWFRGCCALLGPGVVEALVPVFFSLPAGPGRDRVGGVISGFGAKAVPALGPFLSSPEWPVCRAAIQLTARVGGPAAAAALQPMMRSADARRAREVVAVMMDLEESTAFRALSELLMTGTPAERSMALDTLAVCQDPRASGLIATALGGLEPCGRDHELALQMIEALQHIGDEHAVAAIAALAEASDWRHPRQTLDLKRAAAEALAAVPGTQSAQALRAAATRGDRFLRRFARGARRTGA